MSRFNAIDNVASSAFGAFSREGNGQLIYLNYQSWHEGWGTLPTAMQTDTRTKHCIEFDAILEHNNKHKAGLTYSLFGAPLNSHCLAYNIDRPNKKVIFSWPNSYTAHVNYFVRTIMETHAW